MPNDWMKFRPNPLLIVFVVSFVSLCCGTLLAVYDIEKYGAGLYLSLVSVVIVVVVLAFCLVGTEEQTEPTVAKKVWSTTRQTIRRYAKSKDQSRGPPVEIRIVNIDMNLPDEETADDEETTPDTADRTSELSTDPELEVQHV